MQEGWEDWEPDPVDADPTKVLHYSYTNAFNPGLFEILELLLEPD